MRKEKWIYEGKWIIFYWGWRFDLSYETCGYFDARHRINLDLIIFSLTIILPIYSEHTDECDPPQWGIAYHNQTFWVHKGGKGNMNGGNKWWTYHVPWSYDWVRTSKLRKDGKWENETRGNRKDFYKDEWEGILWNDTLPYEYKLRSGEVQKVQATIKVVEMEWRQRWLKWIPLFKKVRKSIDIDFDNEVGERAGSWKGGTVGCGYYLKDNETPYECLRRMEKERTFR